VRRGRTSGGKGFEREASRRENRGNGRVQDRRSMSELNNLVPIQILGVRHRRGGKGD